ncbi:gamma-aminobutyraldehyde dehydrogenase [Arthrobacter crystallopoietes]|uniref:gamma-aminobutyraldehyde dehydrogenase n=1 Tax=Crystallibacter crystallopoietes TaxID=37928 RepID=UPI0011115E41|nr:gamma-aminobutyraldehyde dehydrogenase [Arthrobacter crystallopoietes]
MHQFIDGRYREGRGDEAKRTNPVTGEPAEIIRYAASDDVDDAVAAATRAFGTWSRCTPAERSDALLALAAELGRRAEEIAAVETAQTGKAIRLATEFDVPGTIDNVSFFAGAARQLQGLAAGEYGAGGTSMIRREPIGVIGSIAPWNYPFQMAGWKILPAIAAGNTIVLKPSEVTPGTSLIFAEAATAAGIPDGVINIVTGTGAVAGEHLVRHPGVAMTSFTGSTAVGRKIMALASGRAKRVHLELGGKAPFVVFDDADLEAAAHGAVAGSIINGGQDCTAATRAYIQRPLFDAFTARVAELMDRVVLGDPTDDATDLGSLISHAHRDKVAGFVDRARAAGATVLAGGHAPGGHLAAGAYYRPTLVAGAAQDSEIVQEEVFGPVLTALPFDTDDEALTLANDTPYGLAASAWTNDLNRSLRASAEIQAGCVWINDHIPIVSEMPHGGYKASGFGKDMSAYSLEDYTNTKHVMLSRDKTPHKDWQNTIFRSTNMPASQP